MNIDGAWVQYYIDKHMPRRSEMIRMYRNYKGKDLKVEEKEVSRTQKANNKLKNDFRGYIVDQQNGYFMGKPIQFQLDDIKYDEFTHTYYNEEIQRFLTRNSFDDLSAESDKISRVGGYGGLLVFINKQAEPDVMKINPWECIFVNENGNKFSIYYYNKLVKDKKGKLATRVKAEVYDDNFVTYFLENEDGEFELITNTEEEEINPRKHQFAYNPLIELPNNDERMGDFEKVENLIDEYDFTLSTIQDEIEQFANAYLMVTGLTLDEETLKAIKESGAFSGLEPEDKVEFITKQINDTYIQNQLNWLFDNILLFSASVNMQDESFASAGAESGEARKWRLLALENKAIIKERKMSTALREMWKVICSYWSLIDKPIDYLDIYFTFSRNIPLDLLYLAEIAQKFKGFVSEDTRLGLLSAIIDDIEWEKQKMKEDSNVLLDDYDNVLLNNNTNEDGNVGEE